MHAAQGAWYESNSEVAAIEQRMQQLIEKLWLAHGFTALLVTHDVSEAVALADRILLIEDSADDAELIAMELEDAGIAHSMHRVELRQGGGDGGDHEGRAQRVQRRQKCHRQPLA